MRIHLGCGDKYWPGFVNVDMICGDVQCDVTDLSFHKESAVEIHAIHLFEHLPRLSCDDVVKHWMSILKPKGKLVIEVPCLNKIAKLIVDGERNMAKTLFGLYGDIRLGRPEMLHQWCWSENEIENLLSSCGFTDIKIMLPFFHVEDRDMRIEATKP